MISNRSCMVAKEKFSPSSTCHQCQTTSMCQAETPGLFAERLDAVHCTALRHDRSFSVVARSLSNSEVPTRRGTYKLVKRVMNPPPRTERCDMPAQLVGRGRFNGQVSLETEKDCTFFSETSNRSSAICDDSTVQHFARCVPLCGEKQKEKERNANRDREVKNSSNEVTFLDHRLRRRASKKVAWLLAPQLSLTGRGSTLSSEPRDSTRWLVVIFRLRKAALPLPNTCQIFLCLTRERKI